MSERLYAMTASPVAILRSRKLAEAKRVLAGEGGAPLLTAEAFDQTFDVASLAATVVAKAATEAEVIAAIEAQRQRAQAAIRSAPNPAAIDAVLLELELLR
ncbi:hypothetical protein [Kaistia terrae]|uniref:Uncharacterized protein n=1 Tax=Kaistia terrae TaxID=537017 RepID=A0ABW0Q381_9HYPH|nr:hypothetical protein [Kaistia terrae]MCX5581313.1 hypothetical protein [Kaistia terrae]